MIKKALIKTIVACALFLFGTGICQGSVFAGAAADTLTIRVGYNGMPDDQYVNAGTYHWSELLKNITPVEAAYSFFEVDNIDASTSYETVVDSARGFYLKDILQFANIDLNQVVSIGFYVNDHRTIFTRFDTDDLFADRYYFHDLPGHRRAEGDFWNFDDAWNDYEPVYPMLAIEDNWRTYSDEIEHVDEDFTNLKTESRFRLLFGQREPDEIGMLKKSAKYISTIYVTLNGGIRYFTDDVILNGKRGVHTLELTVKCEDKRILNALPDLLNVYSTNETVLKILDVQSEPSPRYPDLAMLSIDYEIVGSGKASIIGEYARSQTLAFSIGEVEGEEVAPPLVSIYRLYNPKTKEHLYSSSQKEYDTLPKHGWEQEGLGWYAPKSGASVYRLYNPKSKDHHYTSSANEAKVLTTKYGWKYDNNKKPVFYSGGKTNVYRLYNKKLKQGSHHFTTSLNEYNTLPKYGWKQEGVAFKAAAAK